MKARSRLTSPSSTVPTYTPHLTTSAVADPSISNHPKHDQKMSIVWGYVRHLPTLVIGLILTAALYWFMQKYPPNTVQNVLLTNSYLPFLVLLGSSCFFCISFLLLHSRRGFLVSWWIVMMLWLRFQTVTITPLLLVSTITILSSIELLLTLLEKKWYRPAT